MDRMALRLPTLMLTATFTFASLIAACGSPGADAPSSRKLLWHDEFDGARGAPPSARRWTHDTGGSGWGNDELQCYTSSPRNATTDGRGHLVITARQEQSSACQPARPNAYTSARLTTRQTFTFTYGRVEARIKMPAGVGTWPALWALGSDIDTAGWPRSGELDVVEYLPRRPTSASGTVHGPTTTGGHWYLHRDAYTADVLSDDFHVYAMEWSPAQVEFFLDGVRFGTVTRSEAEQRGVWKADHPHFLLLNLAVGGTLGGAVPESTVWPQRLMVDYVRVYA
jgi:beta-glucanase (GH16 family)